VPIRISRASATTVKFSSPQEVVISHLDDSIRLGDGTSLLTSTTSGSKIALDVNDISDQSVSPVVTNIPVASSGTETSFVFPVGTKKIFMKVRDNARLQLSFTSGQSGTNYVTIPPGANYCEPSLNLTSSLTAYFQVSKAAQVVEVLYWL